MAPERKAHWVRLRQAVQVLAGLFFLVAFVAARHPLSQGWPTWLLNLPMRLDPLTSLANLLATRTWQAGMGLSLLTVLLTLICGRAWCGWLCPLGTLLDWVGPARRRPVRSPESWRRFKHFLLLTLLFLALTGNLTLLMLDPLTVLLRSLSAAIWPGLDVALTAVERFLVNIPGFSGPVTVLDGWLRPAVLPLEPGAARAAWFFGALLAGILALNYFAPRFWCRYVCPLGSLLGLLSKLAIFRRQPGTTCRGCTLCTQACPTGTIDPAQGYASDPAECTLCLECLESCPRSSIRIAPGLLPAAWQPYDPGRRQALQSLGLAIGAAALLSSQPAAQRNAPWRLRPPGVEADLFTSQCVRCAECLRACPTSALQPAVWEAGLEGLWTPILLPRLGYCDYACHACGQICPTAAIPPLSLEEKRQQVIGKAYIYQDRCIAWADQTDCIVCEEMCPLPEKAIRLQESRVTGPDGQERTLQLPFVVRERCIGCGICEHKCPLNGEAAIRVWSA